MPLFLPDLFATDLRVVFCGSGVGPESAKRRLYYADRGNAFWRILHETKLTPRRFDPEEYRQLLQLRIGLTDLVKQMSGTDDQLHVREDDVTSLRRRISRWRPRILAFNGKFAAEEFLGVRPLDIGLQDSKVGRTEIVVLPSTSGQAKKHWTIEPWRALALKLQSAAT